MYVHRNTKKNVWTKLHVDMEAKIKTHKQAHKGMTYCRVEKIST